MRNISESQIEFILTDLEQKGITLEELRNNLLDHICCLLENEMPDEGDFKEQYAEILQRFCQKEIVELQIETEQLLTFKNFYAMKNTLKITGILSALLSLMGALLKSFHLPGAGVSLVLGGLLFSLIFLPLLIILKFRDETNPTDKWVLSIGFTIGIFAILGIIFKLFSWPYANILMRGSTVAFVFGYVPLYFISRVRRPEIRFNTTVNAVLMMACGCMLFSLYNLNPNKGIIENQKASQEYLRESIESFQEANTQYNWESEIPNSPYLASAANALHSIDNCKINLVMALESISEQEARSFNLVNLSNPTEINIVHKQFVLNTDSVGAQYLLKQLMDYNQHSSALFGPNSEKIIPVDHLKFEGIHAATVFQQLSQLQWHILSSMNSYLMHASAETKTNPEQNNPR